MSGKVNRKPEWRQECPSHELVVVLMSIEGDVSNIDDGIYDGNPGKLKEVLKRIQAHCQDAQTIIQMLPPNKWPGQ